MDFNSEDDLVFEDSTSFQDELMEETTGVMSTEVLTPIPPAPLARKEIKRRKNTDFLYLIDAPYVWHSNPDYYTYPILSLLPPKRSPKQRNGVKKSPSTYALLTEKSISSNVTPLISKRVSTGSSSSDSKSLRISKREEEPIDEYDFDEKIYDEDSLMESSTDEFQTPKKRRTDSVGDLTSPLSAADTRGSSERIVEALRALGGKGTGADITNWIASHYDDLLTKKKLAYIVNAVLSSRKHSVLFYKETIILDGNKRAMWKLVEDKLPIDSHTTKRKSGKQKDMKHDLNGDTFGGHYSGKATDEEDETDKEDKIIDSDENSNLSPEFSKSGDQQGISNGSDLHKNYQHHQIDHHTRSLSHTDLSKSGRKEETVDINHVTKESTQNNSITPSLENNHKPTRPYLADPIKRQQLTTAKVIPIKEAPDEDELIREVLRAENSPQPEADTHEKPTPSLSITDLLAEDLATDKSSRGSLKADDRTNHAVDEAKDSTSASTSVEPNGIKSITEETSIKQHDQASRRELDDDKRKAPLSKRRRAGSFGAENQDSMDGWTPNGEDKIQDEEANGYKENGIVDESSSNEELDQVEEDIVEEGTEPSSKQKTKKSKSKPKKSPSPDPKIEQDEEFDEAILDFIQDDLQEPDDNDDAESEDETVDVDDGTGKKTGKRGRKPGSGKKGKTMKKKKREFEEEEEEDMMEEDQVDISQLSDKEASTYTEMIANALRSLGGRGTGQEITSYIDHNYPEVLHNKTVTWRNSVMGCLSANRRNLFSKEPVKAYAKRYVWVLNDPAFKSENLETPEPKQKSGISKRRKLSQSSMESASTTSPKEDRKDEADTKVKREKKDELEENGKQEEKPESDAEPSEGEEGDNSQEELEENAVEEDDKESKEAGLMSPTTKKGLRDKNSVELITGALREMGGKATGIEIAEYLATVYSKELGSDVKKLGYVVNAVLSSHKYKHRFVKEKMVQGGQRALWKLAKEKKPNTKTQQQ